MDSRAGAPAQRPPPVLTCTVDCKYPISVVRASGPLTADAAPRLRTAVLVCLAVEPELLVLGVAGLTVDDDQARVFGTLAAEAAVWPGSTLVLAGASGPVAAAMRRTGGHLACYPTLAAARGPVDLSPRIHQPLPRTPAAASVARRLVAHACDDWSVPELAEPAELVVTELVANAVRHAARDVTLTFSLRRGVVQISVHDDSPAPPRPADAAAFDEHGRGLALVEAVTTDWGTATMPDGKVVWAKVAPARQ